MTQEEKELLLKDLCARLPYGVIIESISGDDHGQLIDVCFDCGVAYMGQKQDAWSKDYRPYLRPMSSMTEEERKIYMEIGSHLCGEIVAKTMIDWLNKNYFDYRGLIEKGLALEAPDDMYKVNDNGE